MRRHRMVPKNHCKEDRSQPIWAVWGMKWRIHGRRAVYKSSWVENVEITDGTRIEHHVIRFHRPSVTSVVVKDQKVLLLWRHRFITDTWRWEDPAGWADPGEDNVLAISREIEEETG